MITETEFITFGQKLLCLFWVLGNFDCHFLRGRSMQREQKQARTPTERMAAPLALRSAIIVGFVGGLNMG